MKTPTETDSAILKSLECVAKAAAFEAAGQKAMARIYRSFARGWSRAA